MPDEERCTGCVRLETLVSAMEDAYQRARVLFDGDSVMGRAKPILVPRTQTTQPGRQVVMVDKQSWELLESALGHAARMRGEES